MLIGTYAFFIEQLGFVVLRDLTSGHMLLRMIQRDSVNPFVHSQTSRHHHHHLMMTMTMMKDSLWVEMMELKRPRQSVTTPTWESVNTAQCSAGDNKLIVTSCRNTSSHSLWYFQCPFFDSLQWCMSCVVCFGLLFHWMLVAEIRSVSPPVKQFCICAIYRLHYRLTVLR